MTPFQERLQGSIPALVTPLKQDFTVDSDAIKKTAIRALDNGCLLYTSPSPRD